MTSKCVFRKMKHEGAYGLDMFQKNVGATPLYSKNESVTLEKFQDNKDFKDE